MSISLKRVCFGLGTFLFFVGQLHSAPIPIPGLTGVTFDLFEQAYSVHLTLAGGPVANTESTVFPSVFTYQGVMWKFRSTIELTDSTSGDEVFLLVRLFHDAQPDGAVDDGAGGEIVFSALGSTTGPIPTLGWVFNGIPDTKGHGQHVDSYSVGATSIVSVPGQPSQIGAWSLEVIGTHIPVPEPSLLPLTAAILGGRCIILRARARKYNCTSSTSRRVEKEPLKG
jgi:hypothetical protein